MGNSMLTMLKPSSRERYGSYDVTAYVGRNGSGKTLMALNDVLPILEGVKWNCDNPTHWHTMLGITEGYRNVLTTVAIKNPATGEPHKLAVPYHDHALLTVSEHSHLLLDEMTAIFPARGYGGLPNEVAIKLNQPRKPDLKIFWTAPNWNRADVILREVTEQVVTSRRFGRKLIPGRERPTFSWFIVRSFSGDDWKNWVNNNMKLKIKPETYELYHRRDDLKKGYLAQDYYDSFSDAWTPVSDAGSGTCVQCGGSKASKKCSCTWDTIQKQKLNAARRFWANQYPHLLNKIDESVQNVHVH